MSGVIAMRNGERVKAGDRPLNATFTTANYFGVLGVPMALGRGFVAEEDVAGAPQAVAVLSSPAWETAFGGDPQIIGRRVVFDKTPFTIVGVTGPDFLGTSPLRNDVWLPFAAKKILRPSDPHNDAYLTDPDFCCTPVAARLAPGVTRAQAEAELGLLDGRFEEQHKLERGGAVRLTGTAWIHALARKKSPVVVFSLLFLAVTLVLLLACANVGNLLLARAAARRREIAVRLSIGGSRWRIVRQLLVESATLALGASAIGLTIAFVLPSAIVRRLATDQVFYIAPDVTVLAYTAGIAAIACLAFGLAPALHCTRGSTAAALKGESGRVADAAADDSARRAGGDQRDAADGGGNAPAGSGAHTVAGPRLRRAWHDAVSDRFAIEGIRPEADRGPGAATGSRVGTFAVAPSLRAGGLRAAGWGRRRAPASDSLKIRRTGAAGSVSRKRRPGSSRRSAYRW